MIPYTVKELEISISGIAKEIANRKRSISRMINYIKNRGKSTAGFSYDFIRVNKPKMESEVNKLQVIKAELALIYEIRKYDEEKKNYKPKR